MTSRRSMALVALAGSLLWLGLTTDVSAQALRFGNHREVAVPDYATLRIGSFYSTMRFSQSIGYRYTDSSGSGTTYIFDNARGKIKEDGSELPMITSLDFRNYLLITPNVDLDASFSVTYEHYPLDTQDDDLYIDFAEEGILGNLSMTYYLAPNLVGTVYDNFVYRTDYVDTRGFEDESAGSKYRYHDNTFGTDLDWLFAKDHNLGVSLSRQDRVPHGSDDFEDQERVTYEEALRYEHQLSPVTVAGLEASWSQTEYEVETRGDTDRQQLTAFADSQVTERTLISGSIGVSDSSVDDAIDEEGNLVEEDEGNTVIGSLSLQTRLRDDLSHGLQLSRTERGGFNSAFETVNSLNYQINWAGDLWAAGAYTTFTSVEPSGAGYNDYTDWVFGGRLTIPVVEHIDLYLMSSYRIRDNDAIDEDAADDLDEEDLEDYETWTTRLGTSFGVYHTEFSEVVFNTYVQHTDRMSDSEDLDYERDIFAATFTYHRQF